MIDRRADRRRRAECMFILLQVGVNRLELPNLGASPPSQVAVARIRQIGEDDRSNATRRVEAGCVFARNRLDLHESSFPSQSDRLFKQLFRLQLPAFDPGDLRGKQRHSVREIDWDLRAPGGELVVMLTKAVEMYLAAFGRR